MPSGLNAPTGPLLQLQGVVKRFRSGLFRPKTTMAVDNVDLDLEAGDSLAILGESGSGKSTLARLIARLTLPSQGRILFEGRDLRSLNGTMPAFRRDVQMIFQDADGSLNPRLTVRQLLLEPLHVQGLPVDNGSKGSCEAERLLDLAGLSPEILSRRPSEISGGQRQRIGILRALSLKPRLVVADEPLASLDRSVQAHILCLIRQAQERNGVSCVYISHDIATLRLIARRVAVIYKGRVVESGEVHAVLDAPAHPYTRRLIASDPTRLVLGASRTLHSPVSPDAPDTSGKSNGSDQANCCLYAHCCPEARRDCQHTRPELQLSGERRVACLRV